MALFTDGQINTLQSLERYESGLLDLASVEQIDITAKTALAQDQIGSELLLFLLKHSPGGIGGGIFGGLSVSARRAVGLADVASTEPLQRWHAFKTIELIYRDAYNNQLNDRYKGKWQQYQELAKEAACTLWQIGVGLVADPVAKAVEPLMVSVSGSAQATSYYVRVAWINPAGQEGSPSDVTGLETVDGTQLVVSPVLPPSNAVGWNVYAGSTPDDVSRQNWTPLGVSVDWVVPAAGLRLGDDVGSGQSPDRYVVDRRRIHRG